MQNPRGILIVVEGIDQSGKSTACKNVVEKLNSMNIKCKYQPFPDRTTSIGKKIQEFLDGKDMPQQCVHLLYSANRWEVNEQMKKTLESGTCIICDRYCYSGYVYSVSNGLDAEWCRMSDVGINQPDLLVYLNISLEEADRRRNKMNQDGSKPDRYENIKFQTKVKENFDKITGGDEWMVCFITTIQYIII